MSALRSSVSSMGVNSSSIVKVLAGAVGGSLPVQDLWQPPTMSKAERSSLAVRLDARPGRAWIKYWPEIVKLREDETLAAFSIQGSLVGVRVTRGGATAWEMSGAVLLNPSTTQAAQADVDERDYEAKPFYAPSHTTMVLGCGIQILISLPCLIASMFYESRASPGNVPWWRAIVRMPNIFLAVYMVAAPGWAFAFSGFSGWPSYHVGAGIVGGVTADPVEQMKQAIVVTVPYQCR